MAKKFWTDKELQAATEKVREAFLNAVPPPLNVHTNSPCPSKRVSRK